MAENIEDITIDYTEEGVQTTQQLDKVILTRGSWTTIIFKYSDLDRKSGEFGPPKYSIRRYQKRNGQYQQKSKFNISSDDQAQKIIAALTAWIT